MGTALYSGKLEGSSMSHPLATPTLRRVLAVDDSEMIQAMYKLVMRRYDGCQVVAAGNGVEALKLLDQEYDLILLDINMPVMDGLGFLQALKDQGKKLSAPIVVVSTEGQDGDIKKAMSLGAKAYLVKPFRGSQLHEMIAAMTATE